MPAGTHAGALLDDERTNILRSYHNAEDVLELPYGVMLAQGASAYAAVQLVTVSDILAGIVVDSGDPFEIGLDLGEAGHKPGSLMTLLIRGAAWVQLEESVSRGSPVHVCSSGVGGRGQFRASAVEGATVDLSALARWLTGGPGGGVALLEIDLTNASLADNGELTLIVDDDLQIVTNDDEEPIYAGS